MTDPTPTPKNVPLSDTQKAEVLASQRKVLLKKNTLLQAAAELPAIEKAAYDVLQKIAKENNIVAGFGFNEELEIVPESELRR